MSHLSELLPHIHLMLFSWRQANLAFMCGWIDIGSGGGRQKVYGPFDEFDGIHQFDYGRLPSSRWQWLSGERAGACAAGYQHKVRVGVQSAGLCCTTHRGNTPRQVHTTGYGHTHTHELPEGRGWESDSDWDQLWSGV
jgi:hypothetical protein